MIDLQAVRARAASRAAKHSPAPDVPANVANAAKRLTPSRSISQFATLATIERRDPAARSPDEAPAEGQRARDNRLDGNEEARQERAAIHQFDAGMNVFAAEVAAGIKPWTAQEEMRHAKRRGRALGLGVDADRADRLAARLVQRDRDGDDRRLCIECASARPNKCSKGEAYLPAVLQRCPIFMAARGV